MPEKPPRPYFNARIFWGVDHTKMDYALRAGFIIERVFERGDVEFAGAGAITVIKGWRRRLQKQSICH